MVGVLGILVWRIEGLGYLGSTGAMICYAVIALVVIFQIVQILRVNVPILKRACRKTTSTPSTPWLR